MSNLDNREWLETAYLKQGRSTYDIAREVGCDSKTVHSRLKKYGIPTRKRGENLNSRGTHNYMRTAVINPFQGKTHSRKSKKKMSVEASVSKPHLRGIGNGMYGQNGILNPNYIDGSSPERQAIYASAEWAELLRKVYRRDHYKCQRCGKGKEGSKSLHVHHLKPWAGNPDLRFTLENLITLCKTCHRWVHSLANVNKELLP